VALLASTARDLEQGTGLAIIGGPERHMDDAAPLLRSLCSGSVQISERFGDAHLMQAINLTVS
jgi:hypothetical protein